VCAAFSLVGYTTQTYTTNTAEPWPPDTLWFLRTSGTTYSVYEEWPPDTLRGEYELRIMGQSQMSLFKDAPAKKGTPKSAKYQAPGVSPFPWPPDTMLVVRVRHLPLFKK
jgi:hypothetical protein